MATNEQIKLNITSAFDPGGFSKANNAVKGLAHEAKGGANVFKDLAGAFGESDSAIGHLSKSGSKLMAAFSAGGIWAAAAAGVGLLVMKFFEAKEAAAKLAEEQKKMWREDLIKKTENSLTMLKGKHAQIADEIERGANAAEKIAKAYEGLVKSEVSASTAKSDRVVALLEGERQTKLSGEQDPVKRKAIELDYERQIFEAKKEAAKFERDQKVWMSGDKVNNAENDLDSEKNKLNSLQARAKELEDWMATRSGDSKLRMYGQAKQELEKTRSSISETQGAIKSKSIDVTSARNEQEAAIAANQAAMTREAIVQGDLADKQNEFEKAQQEYQHNLDRRLKVEQQISKQEGKIADLKDKESLREDRRKEWQQQADKARGMSAGGWNKAKAAEDAASTERGKETMSEKRWVEGAKKRMATGAVLSGKDLRRIFNFDDWNKFQGANPFDPAKAAADQVTAMTKNLTELQKLNTNLENALKVN